MIFFDARALISAPGRLNCRNNSGSRRDNTWRKRNIVADFVVLVARRRRRGRFIGAERFRINIRSSRLVSFLYFSRSYLNRRSMVSPRFRGKSCKKFTARLFPLFFSVPLCTYVQRIATTCTLIERVKRRAVCSSATYLAAKIAHVAVRDRGVTRHPRIGL